MYPKKIVIEPTTRCNFKCEMCVKQSPGCKIKEGDLGPGLFRAIAPSLPHVNTLIFTGIGEPLLYDDLETCLSMARDRMPENSTRGFQTNGKLLTKPRALSLLKAGANKICISVDATGAGLFDSVRKGGSFQDIKAAFKALSSARDQIFEANLKMGIEFVLMKKNMDELPRVIQWAGEQGLDFMLVTHLTAYEKGMEEQVAYMDNSKEGLALFDRFQHRAKKENLDLTQYNKILWKHNKSEKEKRVYWLIQELKEEALKEGIYVNLFHLMEEDAAYYNRIQKIYDRSQALAAEYNLDLILPGIRPKAQRHCPFVEEDTLFVNWEGEVSPCYFLWHSYQVMRMGQAKVVKPVFFGNLLEKGLSNVWASEEFRGFREKVKAYEYPNCHSWCEKRCDYVLDDPFYQDCFINDIPCCDCHWNLGFLNCLI
jgi:putative metalloenzyme radical SAM/SPASM domain maturase